MGGNYTFVIVTDRTELDDQIAGQFATAGALTKDTQNAQAGSRAHLRELLAGNERYVFTLIQKFSTEDREPMPVLSDRSDIIVMTDEAHRSQYDQLAANMRAALPNAAFIGFTGTPLIKGQESRTTRGLRRLRLDLRLRPVGARRGDGAALLRRAEARAAARPGRAAGRAGRSCSTRPC